MAGLNQVTALRTNINSFGGQVISIPHKFNGIREKVGSSNLGGFGDNSIDKFYKDLTELHQYRNSKIALTSCEIIEEYLIKFLTKSSDLVTITKDGKDIEESSKINGVFSTINFRKALTEAIPDLVYYGSYLFLIKTSDKIQDFKLVNLSYPYSSISHTNEGKEILYVNGDQLKLNDGDNNYLALRLGKYDLNLDENKWGGVAQPKELIETSFWKASKPIFYGLMSELKLFILKDILTQLIQIQDIVSPNLLVAGVDKNTSPEKAIELSEKIETLINQYGDLTQLISSNADVNVLSQFILNNVRVYPDLLGAIRSTEKLDFSRLTGKNQEIRSELNTTEEQLVNSIGIPMDLYMGRSTNKYDALRQSDRLMARIQSEIEVIDNSVIDFTISYLKSIGKYDEKLNIKCNLFDTTFLNAINSSYKYETSTQYIRNIVELTSTIKGSLEQSADIFELDKFYNYLVNAAELVYPGFSDLIKKGYLDDLKKEAEMRAKFDETQGNQTE